MENHMCNGHDRRIPLDYNAQDHSEVKEKSSGDINREQTTENHILGDGLNLTESEEANIALVSQLSAVTKNRRCFSSRKQLSIPKDLPKHVRKYYKDQNALIESFEEVWVNFEGSEDSHSIEEKRIAKMATIMSKVTFITNLLLLIAKGVAAGLSSSLVMISSMLDSAMDLVSGALMWWSNRAIKYTDYTLYPRGRRKLEPVAIVVLAVIMSFVSVQVIHESVQKIVIYATKDYSQQLKRIKEWSASEAGANLTENSNGTASDSEAVSLVMELVRLLEGCSSGNHAPVFETPTIVICIATVVTKLVLYLVCRRIDNPSVQALAKDHLNDVISNSGAIACGMIAYKLWKYADPIGAMVISISIIINWAVTAYVQIKMLTGYTARPDFIQKITWIVLNHDERIEYIESVIAFHFGNRFLVEVNIVLPGEMSMRQSHDLCEMLQAKIERLPEVERAFIHIDYECDWIVKGRKLSKTNKRSNV